jgi:hypothetical protein
MYIFNFACFDKVKLERIDPMNIRFTVDGVVVDVNGVKIKDAILVKSKTA